MAKRFKVIDLSHISGGSVNIKYDESEGRIKLMGCDIHTFVEIRKERKWEFLRSAFKNPYYHADKPTEVSESEEDVDILGEPYVMNPKFIHHPYKTRNYYVFTALAGVRMEEGDNMICEARGMPEDCSDFLKPLGKDIDLHSHSWLTLEELMNAKWWLYPDTKEFVETVIPALLELGKPEDVRLVFCFDN